MKPKYSDADKSPHWRRTYEYRGIKYDIARNSTWFVLEYPEETARISKLANEVSESREFLYKGAAHAWNDEQTGKQKFYEMVNCAKIDIDWFLDCSLDELSSLRAESEKGFRELAASIEKLKIEL